MSFDEKILNNCEKAIFLLRKLFKDYGYEQYKVSKFEEYDLYMKNKSFLVSENVLTFTDTNGKLMALKPDVTLSIIKNTKDDEPLRKVYYNEVVYRPNDENGFREINQTGLECIGDIDTSNVCEVITLAIKSLQQISETYLLNISHNGFIAGLLSESNADEQTNEAILKAVSQKNTAAVKAICNEKNISEKVTNALCELCFIYAPVCECQEKLENLIINEQMQAAFYEISKINSTLQKSGMADRVMMDFSIENDMNYYNGIIFNGFVGELPQSVLAGGRYDNLVHKMGKNKGAIGFAVYLDLLERIDEKANEEDDGEFINVALPKGRLGEKAYDIFEKSGYECPAIYDKGRKLIFENSDKKVRYFWVKPSDVAIYVEKGAADVGIVGKDILLEQNSDVYEMLDLKLGKCRMAVAAKKDFCDNHDKTLVVATKFPNIAKQYYNSISRQIDIIKLNGSIEIAPLLGLSDVIVDIVETGKTLLENDLEPKETIVNISARLICNKSSYKFKNQRINDLRNNMAQILDNEE